jgi:hypothetical protein
MSLLASGRSSQARDPRAAAQVTITEPVAWLRAAPSLVAPNVAAVRKGEFHNVLGRSTNGRWLKLSDGWLFADLGAFAAGRIDDVPAVAASTTPTTPAATGTKTTKPVRAAAAPSVWPKWAPRITDKQRAIYAAASKAGKDLGMFTVVGDCNSQPPVYLRRVANGEFDGSRTDARLQRVLTKFEASFGRISLAAKGGFGTAAMGDPLWADGALCGVDAGPFECEIWVSRASVVFIELGTGDQYTWRDFEEHYRPLVQLALRKGVLPVLVTKADDLEFHEGAASGHINAVVRRLATEFSVPLLDFHAATRDLPNFGLIDEGDKDFHLDGAGIQRHIEATLMTLAALGE